MHIAPYITRAEYECSCCHELPPYFDIDRYVYSELFHTFGNLREQYGQPIQITSGYRCPKHNEEVGGVTYSPHIFGLALDIACTDREDLEHKRQLLLSINPDIRMGLYYNKNFIHIDTIYNVVPKILPQWQKSVVWVSE